MKTKEVVVVLTPKTAPCKRMRFSEWVRFVRSNLRVRGCRVHVGQRCDRSPSAANVITGAPEFRARIRERIASLAHRWRLEQEAPGQNRKTTLNGLVSR